MILVEGPYAAQKPQRDADGGSAQGGRARGASEAGMSEASHVRRDPLPLNGTLRGTGSVRMETADRDARGEHKTQARMRLPSNRLLDEAKMC